MCTQNASRGNRGRKSSEIGSWTRDAQTVGIERRHEACKRFQTLILLTAVRLRVPDSDEKQTWTPSWVTCMFETWRSFCLFFFCYFIIFNFFLWKQHIIELPYVSIVWGHYIQRGRPSRGRNPAAKLDIVPDPKHISNIIWPWPPPEYFKT